MTTIRTRFFGPGKDAPHWTKPAAEWRNNLVTVLKWELTGKPESTRIYIEGEALQKTYLEVQRTGEFSGMALWHRDRAEAEPGPSPTPRAASVMLGAADPAADRKALAGLHQLRTRLNYPDAVYLAIEAEPRPMLATLFFDREAYDDSLLVAACECFAEAFFTPLIRQQPTPANS